MNKGNKYNIIVTEVLKIASSLNEELSKKIVDLMMNKDVEQKFCENKNKMRE
jgi:hypothetical protein